jgi:hypothetical protein
MSSNPWRPGAELVEPRSQVLPVAAPAPTELSRAPDLAVLFRTDDFGVPQGTLAYDSALPAGQSEKQSLTKF